MFSAVVEYVIPPKEVVPMAAATSSLRPMSYPSGTISWLSVTGSSFETLCADVRGDEDDDVSARRMLHEEEESETKSTNGGRDSREEGGAAVGSGPVLEVEAEVVAADEGLEAGAKPGSMVKDG